ncbi:hypothetical protein VTL71DRAFT_1027 [Oculimacula yallundae]|uniref:P-loop containing nucleoside triphosphate hydrolase protein n=1 Tax=Oculimacula yallundae TaxID=86028 RepID=A0ABR4D415_9HELO
MSMSLECVSGADNLFGPRVHNCHDSFDFTLLFEQSIFGVVPSAILLLTFCWKLPLLRKDESKVSLTAPKTSRTLKQVTGICVASTQLVLLILWALEASQRTKASIASGALAFVASVAVILHMSWEHTRSVRPSAVICTYLFFDILLGIPQCRTLWLRNEIDISVVFTIGLGMKAFMLWLESQGKQQILKAPYQLYPPEALGGIWHQITFWWLNTLLVKGSKSLLKLENLFSVDTDLSSESLKLKFQRSWMPKPHNVSRHSLMLATFACFKRSLLLLAIPRLVSIGFRFSQPLLILRVTKYLDKSKSESQNFGYGLIGATGLVYLGIAVTTSLYKHQLNRVITMIRGSLVVAIYDKTLSLNESTLGDSAALSLMSTDTETICANLVFLDSLVMSPIEIALGIALMARQVGVACLAPVLVSLASTFLGLYIAARAGPLQKLWNQATQERVTFTASVLGVPRAMRMLGLDNLLAKLMSDLRFDELEKSKGARLYVTWRNFVANLSRIFSPFFTFLIFVYARGPSALNASEAFTILALIALITTPIQLLVNVLSQFGVGTGCFERIQAYLTLPEGRPNSTEELPTAKVCTRSIDESTPLQYLPRRISDTFRIEGGCFTYPGSDKPALQNIDLIIPPSSLTIVVGPVGSGKSTLLKAVMSFCSEGRTSSQQLPSDVAYCSQEPWLPNDTVQNIILGPLEMDYEWYHSVLKACDLERDLSSMPLVDQTVGTKGTSLSGGQRQRLALARALYARKPLLLLDDVLSSLDSRTAQTVFENVLGPEGLARNNKMAVVLVTHSESHLRKADDILVLGTDGHIEKQGTFEQIFSQTLQADLISENVTEIPSAESKRLEDEQLQQRPEHTPLQASKFEDEQQDLARKTGDLSL